MERAVGTGRVARAPRQMRAMFNDPRVFSLKNTMFERGSIEFILNAPGSFTLPAEFAKNAFVKNISGYEAPCATNADDLKTDSIANPTADLTAKTDAVGLRTDVSE